MGAVTESTTGHLPVLALNCGSSSLKFGMYDCEMPLADARGSVLPALCTEPRRLGRVGDELRVKLICEGEAEEIGGENSSFWVNAPGGAKRKEQIRLSDHSTALGRALDALNDCGAPEPEAIGHRFVHGGPQVREHQRATAGVIEKLRAAVSFAPLHVPQALSVLDATQQRLPKTAQVVCLDTAFHRTMPDVAKTFALPREVREMGVERYGFHGLSLESILAQLDGVPERLVVAHLGNGASITAIRNGRSIDTTMGLTPTGGVMMGTRCGDLDPGVALYLMRRDGADAEKLERIFDHSSGLLGVSGKSSDVRELLAVRKQEAQADLALRMFCYQAKKAIAGMAAALGGIDALVFTGGIGEHAAELREEIFAGLGFLGHLEIRVLPSQEDLQIARITAGIIRN